MRDRWREGDRERETERRRIGTGRESSKGEEKRRKCRGLTSCTAGEYSMKRAIRTAVFSCHSGSHLCCYKSKYKWNNVEGGYV